MDLEDRDHADSIPLDCDRYVQLCAFNVMTAAEAPGSVIFTPDNGFRGQDRFTNIVGPHLPFLHPTHRVADESELTVSCGCARHFQRFGLPYVWHLRAFLSLCICCSI
jgi:hypothetical protein